MDFRLLDFRLLDLGLLDFGLLDFGLLDFGLYIHWPFCLKKCPYCDFNSYVMDGDKNQFVNGIIRELAAASKFFNSNVRSVFFGGGTPSLIPHDQLKRIMMAIYDNYSVNKHIEVSIEINPSTLEVSDLSKLLEVGINRMSFGMQSLSDKDLKFLGRIHSASEAMTLLTEACGLCENVSADFIYALPGETLDKWKLKLDNILYLCDKIDLKHLSLYQLTIEEETVFAKKVAHKEFDPVNDDAQSELYSYTLDTLAKNGWFNYEISNFAKLNKLDDKNFSKEALDREEFGRAGNDLFNFEEKGAGHVSQETYNQKELGLACDNLFNFKEKVVGHVSQETFRRDGAVVDSVLYGKTSLDGSLTHNKRDDCSIVIGQSEAKYGCARGFHNSELDMRNVSTGGDSRVYCERSFNRFGKKLTCAVSELDQNVCDSAEFDGSDRCSCGCSDWRCCYCLMKKEGSGEYSCHSRKRDRNDDGGDGDWKRDVKNGRRGDWKDGDEEKCHCVRKKFVSEISESDGVGGEKGQKKDIFKGKKIYDSCCMNRFSDEGQVDGFRILTFQDSFKRPAYIFRGGKYFILPSLHNLGYWQYKPYLGIGPGAHSRMFVNENNNHRVKFRVKFDNEKSPIKWLRSINSLALEPDVDAVALDASFFEKKNEFAVLSEREEFEEKMMMGLRIAKDFELVGDDLNFLNLANLQALSDSGFLSIYGDGPQYLHLSRIGKLCLNSVLKFLLK